MRIDPEEHENLINHNNQRFCLCYLDEDLEIFGRRRNAARYSVFDDVLATGKDHDGERVWSRPSK